MKTRIIIGILTILSIIACNEQAKQTPDIVLPEITVDEAADLFAKILSTSMNNPEMLEFIREMSDERFDGDENFLIMDKIDDNATKSNITFYDMLSSVATKSTYSYSLDSIIEAIKINDPLLQIYVMNSDLWDSGIEPLVVLLPENYDDEFACTLTGYMMNGETFSFSSEDEIKDAPVVVLSRNERTIASVKGTDGSGLQIPFYSNDSYDYYLKGDIYVVANDDTETTEKIPNTKAIDEDITVAGQLGSAYTNCHRIKNHPTKDRIDSLTIVSKEAWTAIESGWLGDPELELYIIYATKNGSPVIKHTDPSYELGEGNFFNNRTNIKWYAWDRPLLNWSLADNGDRMLYSWIEIDDGKGSKNITERYTIQIYGKSLLDGSYTYSVGAEDNYAGSATAYYVDKQSTVYETNRIRFVVGSYKTN